MNDIVQLDGTFTLETKGATGTVNVVVSLPLTIPIASPPAIGSMLSGALSTNGATIPLNVLALNATVASSTSFNVTFGLGGGGITDTVTVRYSFGYPTVSAC